MSGEASRDDLVARGKAAFSEGRYEDAVTCLAPAAKADLTDPDALALLGASYSFLGRHAAAIAAFERALEVKPGSPRAHHNLAVAFEQAGRPDDAVVHYRKAAQLDPNHAASARALRRLAPAGPTPPAAPEAPPTPQPAPIRRRALSRRVVLGVLGALVVAVAAAAGTGVGWKLSSQARQRRAEQRAQQCRRNVELLTQALLDYAHSNDDALPVADGWISAAMAHMGSGSSQDSPLHCPSDSGSQPSYAMNPVLSEKRLDEIGAPDETILLYEVHENRPVLRHLGTAFYAFVDGHIERRPQAPDHLWRLKRPANIHAVDPGRRPPMPEPEPEPETEPAEDSTPLPDEQALPPQDSVIDH